MKEEPSTPVWLPVAHKASSWLHSLRSYTNKSLKFHPLAFLGVGLALALAAMVLVAQRSTAALSPAQLATAIALYQHNALQQAQSIFAAVDSKDPSYAMAQAYDALCRYALCREASTNDYRWFLKALASPVVLRADLPTDLREDLAFKEIDAIYQSGQFQEDDALPKIAAFKAAYPGSSRLNVVAEYELAARLEKGMQWIYKAALVWPRDLQSFQNRLANGQPHLEEFLKLCHSFPTADYENLRDRSLAEDLKVALAVLAGEPVAVGEIKVQNAERRERYGLVRLGMHQKLKPEAWQENLQMLAEFEADLQTYSPSPRRPRVEYDLARLAFRAGERFWQDNAGALPSEADAVAAKCAGTKRYFETVRKLAGHFVVNEAAGVGEAERGWVRQMWFASFHYDQDYDGLKAAAEAELAQTKAGELDWLRAKVFSGIALYRQSAPQRDSAAAAKAFEEVLAYGFLGENEHDVMIADAVGWRMQLAMIAGDQVKVRRLLDWVKQSQCEAKAKAKFFQDRRDYAVLVEWAGAK